MSWHRGEWLTALVFLMSAASFAQGAGSPEQAIVEMVLASDLKTAEKHFPAVVARSLADLSPQDLGNAAQILIPINKFHAMGVTPRAAENGTDILILDPISSGQPTAVRVVRRIADGADALLQFEFCAEGSCRGGLQLWMKLDEGEWRIHEINESPQGYSVRLDDPKFIARLRNPEQNSNEQRAIGSLRTLVTALVNYSSSFADIGFPQEIGALTGNEDEPNAQHAGLVDRSFESKPCIRQGYRFEYTLIRQGPEGTYSITARPTQFGKTGTQSFYADETGVIRATREDRLATADDDPIQ